VTHFQSFNAQAAEARAQAAAAQADAAQAAAAAREAAREGAREAARAAREQAREQAQMARDQAQMVREQAQMARDMARIPREVITVPPFGDFPAHGPSPRQEKMLFAGFIIVVLAAVAILHPLMRAFARRLEGHATRPESLDTISAERLQRIEQAVDAMAIEIERISEGQRFTTKLLSSRADAPVSLNG
jgi:flagellar biosynthesis GTPase FlhF